MRVLIFSAAVLACAAAAPYYPYFAYNPLAFVPIPAGDLQAAAIDAKVDVENRFRAAADQARELAEHAMERKDEGVMEANDLAKERAEEAFWAAEERKWQELDAMKTAEAMADGAAAAKAAIMPEELAAPAVADSAVVAEVKTAAPAEEKKEEKVEANESAAVKSAPAESESAEKPEKAADKEAVEVESAAATKSTDEKKEVLGLPQPVVYPIFPARFVAGWPTFTPQFFGNYHV